MTRKQIVNIVSITILIIGLCLMFISKTEQIVFLGIGFFVSSTLTALFNNISNNDNTSKF